MVSHGRENKHDFVKTVPDKCWNLLCFSRTSRSYYTGSTAYVKWWKYIISVLQLYISFTSLVVKLHQMISLFLNSQTWNIYTWAPFNKTDLTWIPTWIHNHIPSKAWDEIIHPLFNSNGAALRINTLRLNNGCNYFSMPESKWIHVSKP